MCDQQNMWWNEVRLIMWENEEDLKCTIKLTEKNFFQLIPYPYAVEKQPSNSGSIVEKMNVETMMTIEF